MKKNRLFAILIAFFTFSCFAQNWKADHVFLIGLDGWGAYSVEKAVFSPVSLVGWNRNLCLLLNPLPACHGRK